MKTASRSIFPWIFSNPIARNITLIFMFGFLAALGIVTLGVIVLNQILG